MTVNAPRGLLIFLLLFVGCSGDLTPSQSWTTLSVGKYQDLTATDDTCSIVPVEKADSVDFGWQTQQDAHDYWWNLNGIAASEHELLLADIREKLILQGYAEQKSEFVANRIPKSWPKSLLDADWPAWWKTDDSRIECAAWERETNGGSSTRSYGWVLLYDGDKERISIWHLNRQHSWFGWSDERRDGG